jgi:hypothetical protein
MVLQLSYLKESQSGLPMQEYSGKLSMNITSKHYIQPLLLYEPSNETMMKGNMSAQEVTNQEIKE